MQQSEVSARFIDLALEKGLLLAKDKGRLEALSKSQDITADRAALSLGLIEEGSALRTLAEVLQIDFLDRDATFALATDSYKQLGHEYLSKQCLFPLAHNGEGSAIVAADPANEEVLAELRFHLGSEITVFAATTSTIREALNDCAQPVPSTELRLAGDQEARDLFTFQQASLSGPVVTFVAETLSNAVQSGASDIHFEATNEALRVRIRERGLLRPIRVPPEATKESVAARLKVMASLNVSERRLPQDGRIRSVIAGRAIDFRVSCLPTQHGESIVCRILDPKSLQLGWEELGFEAETISKIKRVLDRPSGLFLVTGPTGSGKTTTLYTALDYLNHASQKIITVEDPVEYELPGVEQVHVHAEAGLTFGTALRSVLRQDPNIIMIGEIRDEETAEMACRAALVGRLVLSTLHTSSAPAAVARLRDLGVQPYLIDDVLSAVVAQELRPSLCQNCGKSRDCKCELPEVGRPELRAEFWDPNHHNEN